MRTRTFALKTLAAAFAALALSVSALAQGQLEGGSAEVGGQIANSVQLVSNGDSAVTTGVVPGTPVTTHTLANNAISSTIIFGEVSTNNTTAAPFILATVRVRIRSNCGYKLMLQRGGAIPSGAANSGDFRAGDLGIGLREGETGIPNGNGALVLANAGINARAGRAAGFAVPNNWPASLAVTNGQVSYAASLNEVGTGTPTTIITGTRVSNGGDNSSTNNSIGTNIRFAVKPQYYTPATFSETLSFSIVASP